MRFESNRNSKINVTPYIDILLVLLIIFMVIQPTAEFELEARAPQTERGDNVISTAALLEISGDGRLQLNGQSLEYPELGGALFDWFKGRANHNIFVKAPGDTPFGIVAGIVDVAKGAGAGDVGLLEAIEPERE